MRAGRQPITRNAILELLKAGDHTARDLAGLLSMDIKAIEGCIRITRAHAPDALHIVTYRRQYKRPGREAPVYRYGPGEDAKRPNLSTPEVKAEYRRTQRENAKARQQRIDEARMSGRIASPFDQIVRDLTAAN